MKYARLVPSVLLALAGALAPPARAQNSGPILSLNPGGHTATVGQVLWSPDGRELMSAGEDKVVRFWDPATGKSMPQRHIRGQAGEGAEGKPYAAALSPDGGTLAVGGFIRRATPEKDAKGAPIFDYVVRLIDPHTGRQTRLLSGPHNAILALAFSPRGGKLAAGSADRSVTVWDLATDKTQANADHARAVYGVAFSPDGGRVASVSSDKIVRVWDLAANRSRALKGHEGVVRCVAWSPDGQTLATGGFDHTLRLWDPGDGKLRQTLPEAKNVTCVAFSPDGRLLAAGLGEDRAAQCAVQLWDVADGRAGGAPARQFLGHTATVQAVAFGPSGRTVASAGGVNNDIYIWDAATGAETHHMVSTGGAVQDVAWSPDNSELAWRAAGAGARVFDLAHRALVKDAAPAGWRGAVTEQGGRTLAVAPDNPQQVVITSGGRGAGRITLAKPGDFVRCFTWTPAGRIVVGSAFGLGLYDAGGRALKASFVGHAADVLGVSVSPDGKYLASGSGDQTVKIWPLAGDAGGPTVLPLLSLFVGADGEWVAWSHFGFYACSPDGENIIGWQINGGDERAAEYYPASRVGKSLHREDIISHLLETGDEAKAIAVADAKTGDRTDLSRTVANLANIAPPDVKILNAKDGDALAEPQAALRVAITDPNGRALKNLQVTDNGQPVTLADAALRSGEQTLTVPLTDGENTISLLATNDADSASNPASVRLTYRGAGAVRPGAQTLTMLSIGVSKYDSPAVNALEYPAKDARDVAAAFKAQQGKLFSRVDVLPPLTDDNATRENIITALTTLRKKRATLKANDYTVVFVAGHGTNTETGDYYFAPFDVDLGSVEATGVDWSIFTRTLSQLPGHVILMLDTCHSAGVNGKVSNKDAYGQYLTALYSKRFNNESPLIMLTSCDQNEISLESRAWNNGAFTRELIAGLNGAADGDRDGSVTIKELSDFVHAAVLKLTDNKQTPRFVKPAWIADSLPVTVVKRAQTASAAPAPKAMP